MPVVTPARPSFSMLFMHPFPLPAWGRQACYSVPSEGGPSVVWNLVHCPSFSKRKSFWDVESSIVSCCGRHGVEATEAFTHIAMETVVRSSSVKDKTNPIPCLTSFLKIYFKTWCSRVHPQGFAIPSTARKPNKSHTQNSENRVTHRRAHMHILKYAQELLQEHQKHYTNPSVYHTSVHVPPGKTKHD